MYFEDPRLLEIDLTNKVSRVRTLDQSTVRKYVGGRALGSKLLFDLLPRGVDPLAPENLLLVLVGPVTGTLVPTSSKYVVVSKSPLTGGFVDSYSSGCIAPQIRHCGLVGLAVSGKASSPVYLFVKDGQVEFRDASHLWGRNTIEAEDQIKRETSAEAGVMVIGPAGENMVRYASINSDHYRQAARGGVGAVMGAKNLKGIAVLGSGPIVPAQPEKIKTRYLEHLARLRSSVTGQARKKYGTPMTLNITNNAGMLPVRNFTASTFPEAEDNIDGPGVAKLVVKSRSCWGCMIACSKITAVNEGSFSGDVVEGPEYETLGLLGANVGVTYLPAVIRANILCDELGLDTISTGCCIGFLMECFQRGILSEKEIGVSNPSFGNYNAVIELIKMIAYRQGIGDVLAEGVKRAAEAIGKGSHKFAMHVKGMEFPAYEPRRAFGACLSYAVSPRGACHRRAWPPAKEVLGGVPPFTTEGKAALVKRMYDENTILHSLLVCDFPNKFIPVTIEDYADYLSLVTGVAFTSDDLWLLADRAETQIRLFNLREGFTRADDTLPDRVFEEVLPDGGAKGQRFTRQDLEKMLDEYYQARKWDLQGVPLPETLKELGIVE
ncbi:MAG: aldehyde ferredoxin oxidoreductase family protein [Bacillota bacterium]